MILPIVAYGDPVLHKVAEEIDQDYPGLDALIENMYETMYNAQYILHKQGVLFIKFLRNEGDKKAL